MIDRQYLLISGAERLHTAAETQIAEREGDRLGKPGLETIRQN